MERLRSPRRKSARHGSCRAGAWLLAACLASNAAQTIEAAQDGQPGLTSTGSLVLTIRIDRGITVTSLSDGDDAQVANLSDIEIGVAGIASDDIVRTERICVSGKRGERYSITAFSDLGGSAPFTVGSDQGDLIEFEVYFNGDLSRTVGVPLVPGVPSQPFPVQATGLNCNGEVNAELKVVVPAAEIRAAPPSTYAGFLTLNVAIE